LLSCDTFPDLGEGQGLSRFLAYTYIVHLNCFPLFLLTQKAQKKKLGKKKMP